MGQAHVKKLAVIIAAVSSLAAASARASATVHRKHTPQATQKARLIQPVFRLASGPIPVNTFRA
jgi:hypothetical protein